MISPTGSPAVEPDTAGASPRLHEDDELQVRYRAYRRRQAARLLQLIPREAVRPLYRRALERLPAGDRPFQGDPLALVTSLCETFLPLPPMEVWHDDLVRNPDGHLRDLEESVHGPTADAPATLASREMVSEGRRWRVLLRSFRDEDAWRGFMVFEDQAGGPSHHTAIVFRERDPLELRSRFRSFEPAALEAFLRSSRP